MKGTIKVMLVDDEEAIRGILRKTIPWENYMMEIVGEASSGIEALHAMDRMKPDLVLVDIKMPFMDGLDFSRIAMQQYPELVIFIITAYEEFSLVREALRAGVADFLLKPVQTDELMEKLNKAREKILNQWKQQKKQVIISIGDPEKVVSKINTFIYENYEKPELNVAYVANVFGFDRSYLSRMYKKETGELLIDFLIKVRMEIAKKKAASGQKMYQVASQVGMVDAGYFGKCFKKHTGLSFREYQKGFTEERR